MTTQKRECKNCGAALRANQTDPQDNQCDRCYEAAEDTRYGLVDRSDEIDGILPDCDYWGY